VPRKISVSIVVCKLKCWEIPAHILIMLNLTVWETSIRSASCFKKSLSISTLQMNFLQNL